MLGFSGLLSICLLNRYNSRVAGFVTPADGSLHHRPLDGKIAACLVRRRPPPPNVRGSTVCRHGDRLNRNLRTAAETAGPESAVTARGSAVEAWTFDPGVVGSNPAL